MMTSMERTLTALSHKEPDRVPIFLMLSLYGAKELGMTVKSYFSKPENVIKGQQLMKNKYNNDCYYTFHYAGLEIQAMGGEVIFQDETPPNAGEPIIKNIEDIDKLKEIDIESNPYLRKVLEVTTQLKKEAGNETPIAGVVMSPFSIPVMQMGFDKYMELIFYHPEYFKKLMNYNYKFCVDWANAQLKAGATAICYFDPLTSYEMSKKNIVQENSLKMAESFVQSIAGPAGIHLASARTMDVTDEIIKTKMVFLGFSCNDNIELLKDKCRNKITLLGNMNAIKLRTMTKEEINIKVKDIIQKAAPGGGYIFSDTHGEIPYQISEDTLFEVCEAVKKYGEYPIK